MPIYEYRCNKCDHVTEFLESSSSEGPHACEQCGSQETTKVFSTFSARSATPPSPKCSECPSGTCPFSR